MTFCRRAYCASCGRDLGQVACYSDTNEPVVGCTCGYRLPLAEVKARIAAVIEDDKRALGLR